MVAVAVRDVDAGTAQWASLDAGARSDIAVLEPI